MAIRFDEMAFRDAYKRLSREQKERFFPGGEEQAKKSIKSLVWLLGSDCGYDRLFVLYLTIAARIQLDIEPERISFTIKQRFSDLVPDSRISAVIACIERINENYAYIDRINSPEMKAKERTFDKQNEARFRENEKKFNDAERIPNFGIGIDNPIYAHFSFGSYRYLNLLYTDDNTPLTWHRLGSYECDDCDDLLDKYDLLLPDGKVYLSIFINMYSRKESIFCPRGLIGKGLKTVPEIAPDNGEPSLEEIEEDVEDEEFSAFLQNYAKDAPKTAVPQAEESGSISVTPKEITESDQSEENVSHIESCSEPKELLYENLNPILLGSFPVILVMSMVFKQGTQIFARCSFLSISDKPIRAMQIDMQCYNVWHEGIQSVNGFEYLDLKVDRDQSFGADMVLPLPDPATRAIDIVIHRIAFADGTLLQRSGADNTAIPEMILLEKSLGSNELVHEYAAKTCQNVKYMPVRFGAFWRCTCGAINREDELICHKCADTAEVLFANLDQKTLQASVDKKKQIQKEKEEQERIEREQARRKAEEEESARKAKEVAEAQERAEKRRKRWKRFAIISSTIVAVALAAYLIGWQAIPAGSITRRKNCSWKGIEMEHSAHF